MEPSIREAIAAGLDESSEAPAPLMLGEIGQAVQSGPAPAPLELEGLETAAGAQAPAPMPLDQLERVSGAGLGEPPSELAPAGAGAVEAERYSDGAPEPSPLEGPAEVLAVTEQAVTEEEAPTPMPLDELVRLEARR